MAPDPTRIPSLEAAFELERELGRGGFGSVFLGQPRQGGAPVAVKLGIDHGDADQRLRILREVHLLQKLRHPRLANLLGLYETQDKSLALVYELVEGTPLHRLLGGRPVDPRDTVRWLSDLVEALGYLHGHGVLHRDLKSANVIVEPDGRARLLDFGLARAVAPGGTITATGLLFGTPEFMAPELFRGDQASPATDRYALAAMVHEWVTGNPPATQAGPFGRRSVDERALGRLPRALARALERALAAAPEDRPGDLETLFVELEGGLLATPEAVQGATRRVTPPPAEVAAQASGERPQPATPRRGRPLDSTPRRAGVRSEISRKLRSRRLAFRRGSVGLCLLIAAVAAWSLSRQPAPPPPPTEVPVASDEPARESALGDDFLKSLEWELQELEGLYVTKEVQVVRPAPGLSPPDGATGLLTPDYRFFHLRRERMPSVRRYADWVATGGSADELEPEVLEDLQRLDTRWAAEGLERPFHPFLYVEPAKEAVRLPQDVLAEGQGAFPSTVEGWLASAVEWSEIALRNQQELGDQVRRLLAGEAPPTFGEDTVALRFALQVHDGSPLRIFGVLDGQSGYRESYGELVRSISEPVECVIYAVERHLQEAGKEDLQAAWIGRSLLMRIRGGMVGHLLERDTLRVLPGLPETLAQWFFASYVAENRADHLGARFHPGNNGDLLYRLAVQEVLARTRGGDETWPLRVYTIRRFLVYLLEEERSEEASGQLQKHWDDVQAFSTQLRAQLLSEFYCRDQPSGAPIVGLLPDQVPKAKEEIRAHWEVVLEGRPSLERRCGPRLGLPGK
jgi:serine/threonine protein kinase